MNDKSNTLSQLAVVEKSTQEKYLCFKLGEQLYGIRLLSVKEVIGIPEITPIAKCPDYFKGIMNLRGQVISIIDLRLKRKIKAEFTPDTSVIIVDFSPLCLGVIVDSIESVLNLRNEDIGSPPDLESAYNDNSIVGVFKKASNLVFLLNLHSTLNAMDFEVMKKRS